MVTVVHKKNRTLELGAWLTLTVLEAMAGAAPAFAQANQANGPISYGNRGCRLNLPGNCTVSQAKQQLEDSTTTTLQKGNAVVQLSHLGQRDASVLPYLINRFALEIKNGVPDQGDSLDQFVTALNLLAYQNPKAVETAFSDGANEANRQYKSSQHVIGYHKYEKDHKIFNDPIMAPESVKESDLKRRFIALQQACSDFKEKISAGPIQSTVPTAPSAQTQATPAVQAPTPGKGKPSVARPLEIPAPALPAQTAQSVSPQGSAKQSKENVKIGDVERDLFQGTEKGEILQSDGTYTTQEALDEDRGRDALSEANASTTPAQAAPQSYSANGLLALRDRLNDEAARGDKAAVRKTVQAIVNSAKQPRGEGASEILMLKFGEEDFARRIIEASSEYKAGDSRAIASAVNYKDIAAIVEAGLIKVDVSCTSFGIGRKYLIDREIHPDDLPNKAVADDIDRIFSNKSLHFAQNDPSCHTLFQTQNEPDLEKMPLDQVAFILQDNNPARRAAAATALGQRGGGDQELLKTLARSIGNELDRRVQPALNEVDPFNSLVDALQEQGRRRGANDPGDVGPAFLGASETIYNFLKSPYARNSDGSANGLAILWQRRLDHLDEKLKTADTTCNFKAGIIIFENKTVPDGATPQRVFVANLFQKPMVGIPPHGCRF